MEFKWIYRYVPEGQMEPDDSSRWALDCCIEVNIQKALPEYKEFGVLTGDFMPVVIATIEQKGTLNGIVPSINHKFCCSMPCFLEAANFGMSHQFNFFSNDIEELKKKVEDNFIHIQKVFLNVK